MAATKTNWKQVLKDRMKKHNKECMACLRSGYAWDDTKRTLKLMNTLLKDLPNNLWPESGPTGESWDWPQTIVSNGKWHMTLSLSDKGKRLADLRHDSDDHSAWVVEHARKKGEWKDYDIGGS